AAAARALLTAKVRQVPLATVEYPNGSSTQSRYFLTVAGVGADAEMLYDLAFQFKTRFGMLAYYAVGARLWLTHRFPPFTVEFDDLERGVRRRETVTQILAVRVTRFGELLHQLAPGAALDEGAFRMVLFKTAKRLMYFR